MAQEDQAIYQCGEGWFPIIDRALEELRALDPNLEIAQIKEKFGGLRLYIDPSNWDDELLRARFNKVIQAAEDEASETCEQCGSTPARMYAPRGWWRTLCEEHAPE